MNGKISSLSAILITTAAFIIVVAGMRAATAIVIPFLLAVFIAIICSPPLFWLQRRGVPKALAVSVILLGLLVIMFLLVVFVGRSLNAFSQQLPTYQERLSGLITQSLDWLKSLGVDVTKLPVTDFFSPGKIMRLVSFGLGALSLRTFSRSRGEP